jgi:hypothetical protein
MSPFIIGVYVGDHKPKDFNLLLRPFVDEIKLLNGKFSINGKSFKLKDMKFILDLPARASITKTKLLGYYGCPLCEIKGTVFKSSVYYPGEQNAPRRTDESFKAKTASAFHKGTSILEELNIGMLTSIPLDPMHTVDEGIVMKYLGILKSNRTLFGAKELDFKHINDINESMISMNLLITSQFSSA